MENCKICNQEFKNLKALSTHLNFTHNISSKDYYDKHLSKLAESKCVVCGGETTYRGLGVGYLKTCSLDCRNNSEDYRKKQSESKKGKKQSKEQIKKRIKNTNQADKEKNRKQTMLDKHGVDNPSKLDSVKKVLSEKNKGKQLTRTSEWQYNIIESKRNNGTLKHTDEAKTKISNSLNKFYSENLDREKYISSSNNVKHLSGWYNGLYFRSSLELSFLVNNSHKSFSSCEIKKYAVTYLAKDKIKKYYPDYTDGELIYEIKPTSLLNFAFNQDKITAAKEKFGDSYKVITEQESNYISKEVIKQLIENGSVILVKNSEKTFEKYKH